MMDFYFVNAQFKVENSFKKKLMNGEVNISNLILSKMVKYIIKDKDGKKIHQLNIPIKNKIHETEDDVSVLYIGGEYSYTFPKMTSVGKIQMKLGNHLIGTYNYDNIHDKETKLTFKISPNLELLRIS